MTEPIENKGLLTNLDEAFIAQKEAAILANTGVSDVQIAIDAGIKSPRVQASRIASKPAVRAHLDVFRRKIRKKVEKRYLDLLQQNQNLSVAGRMVEVGIEALEYKNRGIRDQYNIAAQFNADLDLERLDEITNKLKKLRNITQPAEAQQVED